MWICTHYVALVFYITAPSNVVTAETDQWFSYENKGKVKRSFSSSCWSMKGTVITGSSYAAPSSFRRRNTLHFRSVLTLNAYISFSNPRIHITHVNIYLVHLYLLDLYRFSTVKKSQFMVIMLILQVLDDPAEDNLHMGTPNPYLSTYFLLSLSLSLWHLEHMPLSIHTTYS